MTGAGPVTLRVAQLVQEQTALKRSLRLREVLDEARQALQAVAGLSEPQWWQAEDVEALLSATRAVETEEALRASRQLIDQQGPVLRDLCARPDVHETARHLRDALERRDADAYQLAFLRVQDLQVRQALLAQGHQLLGRLKQAAPDLAGELLRTLADSRWDERLPRFTAAWRWLQADAHLALIANPDTEVSVREQLAACRQRMRTTLGALVATHAWSNTLNRLTQKEQQGLNLWKQAIKSPGKGTGKHAERHRRSARAALEQARTAIPAWIMPLHLVAESFEVSPGMFDVVIVDEASQAGPEALFLAFIGKKIVVVGDDKQIEPEAVGIVREKVDALVQQHLYDFPTRDAIGKADASLFSIGEIAYPPTLTLREHFRCMPEIIAFSTRLSYPNNPLIALRQYGADRLPPLMDQHVPEGYTTGKDNNVNPPEARGLVDQLKACLNDPRYATIKDGAPMTFGVISLLGDAQAEYIAGLLRREVGEDVLERRRLVCGNAYSVQGDERDVIFLSMVTSPTEGRRETLRADDRLRARLNVAASRARDQLWLFHSVDLGDLKDGDLRGALIQHVQQPVMPVGTPDAERLQALTEEASRPGRGRLAPPTPFDSWFEVDVYLDIATRGYRVLPQYEVNHYRIDLVVVGQRGRIAVECDGDHWHGPEQYDADLHRQQTLERAGWTFWRLRGSTYYRERHAALEDLWATLDRHQVYPIGDERDLLRDAEPAVHEPPSDAAPQIQADLLETVPVVAHHAHQAPYRQWTPRKLPDPRVVGQDEVLRGLTEIIAAEGPLPSHRAYSLYTRAAGLGRMGKEIQSIFNRAVSQGVRQGELEQADEWGRPGQMDKIVRAKGSPAVVLRERGPRDFDELPPRELAALMHVLLESGQHDPDDPQHPLPLYRSVLAAYGAQRLTERVRQALERAEQFLAVEALSN